MIYSAFVLWHRDWDESKGPFVVNFHNGSQNRPKGRTKTEMVPSFGVVPQNAVVYTQWLPAIFICTQNTRFIFILLRGTV